MNERAGQGVGPMQRARRRLEIPEHHHHGVQHAGHVHAAPHGRVPRKALRARAVRAYNSTPMRLVPALRGTVLSAKTARGASASRITVQLLPGEIF